MDTQKCIDRCNSLLSGEISAVEAYEKALEKFDFDPSTFDLEARRSSHQQSVADLQANVRSMGGTPAVESGAWGVLTGSIQSVSNLFGDNSALASLTEGEEHGKRDYESALKDENVMIACKNLFSDTLLPRIEENLRVLHAVRALHK